MTELVVTTGDPSGVGPEISLHAALCVPPPHRVTVVGDVARLRADLEALAAGSGIDGAVRGVDDVELLNAGVVDRSIVARRGPSAEGGAAQLAALDLGIELVRERGGALVTGPMSKAAVELSGTRFTGQTEHLARAAELAENDVTMMFLGPRLKVALATTHVAIADLPGFLRPWHVKRAIRHLSDALVTLRVVSPVIAVCGLNPHASEGGLFGREEATVIAPAVEASRGRAALLGPLGAETCMRWAHSGKVGGVVAMFHDQATIASKLLDWGEAVNVTWGLPFVRTSVDHGVAYDAVGHADASGMRAAMRMALELAT
ncbi:MAG: PdxA family protein [Sandaracinaceae bacterium]